MDVATIVWNGQLVSVHLKKNSKLLHREEIWLFTVFCLAHGANGERLPIAVYARAYIYFMQNLEAHDLVCDNCMNAIQLRVTDLFIFSNLNYTHCSSCALSILGLYSKRLHHCVRSK